MPFAVSVMHIRCRDTGLSKYVDAGSMVAFEVVDELQPAAGREITEG